MGSGHILVYAFDMFMQLYVAEGFRERDAAESIIKNNLFGLEIDKRAYQLAYFAIMMKAREYSRRILNKHVHLNLYSFINSTSITSEYFERLEELSELSKEDFEQKKTELIFILTQFEHATEVGSVLNFDNDKAVNVNELLEFINVFDEFSNMDILYQIPEMQTQIIQILNIVEVLSSKYAAVTTNPPYLNKMSAILDKYVKSTYPDVKTDLFSVFIKMNSQMLVKGGYAGFMTPFVWMFIKSYEQLRTFLVNHKSISSLVQMEYSAFEEATVPVCCFTIKNEKNEPIGNYFKLSEFRGGMAVQNEKILEAVQNPTVEYFYQTDQKNFTKIPGSPISFWVSENIINLYNYGKIADKYVAKEGVGTRNDQMFLRNHWEIDVNTIGKNKRWLLTDKAGMYRKWYLGQDFAMNWENDGEEIKNYRTSEGKLKSRPQNIQYLYREGISWGKVGSGASSFRFRYPNLGFNDAAPTIFGDNLFVTLASLNSKVTQSALEIKGGTLNVTSGVVESLPLLGFNDKKESLLIEALSKENIQLSKLDWDNFEMSFDFEQHPLT